MRDEAAIGVDIGGTKIHFAVVDNNGQIRCQDIVPTRGERGAKAVMDTVASGIARMLEGHGRLAEPPPIAGIGIGSAGQIHYRSGEVAHALDGIPGWIGTPIKRLVEERFPYPVYLDNDVNVIGIAEKQFGKGRTLEHFICLALGTGVGGAIVQSGRLLRGVYGGAGELGHISVDFNGPRCPCGNFGCLELYASGTGIARMARERSSSLEGTVRDIDSRGVMAAWHQGEQWAEEIMDIAIRALSAGISGMIHTFNPQAVFIGGGVASSGDRLMNRVSEHVRKTTASAMWKEVELLPASMGAGSGVIGAAAQGWFYSMPRE
ncbi:ROK family protein [Paenibacillus hemerocallicola]|uniref:ROK family protein n=1 Tax=Paenibacillus hemerocallicola TaxID=1172614 RepID=A0A5C4TFP9_9BACL|nr:ROK family protein [Paenibacillus hemerocallicola]TNJ67913.1 ROK family protein [Paenibacillus hemerocallicola]